jgi:hypothetical protein
MDIPRQRSGQRRAYAAAHRLDTGTVMHVTPADGASAAIPSVTHDAHRDPSSRCGGRLRAVLNQPPQSTLALPLAVAVGATAGGVFASAFQGLDQLGFGTAFGAALGAAWLYALRAIEHPQHEHRAHVARVEALKDYPAVRKLLHAAGASLDDVAAVKQLSNRLDRDIRIMSERFRQQCEARSLSPAPLMEAVLRDFYLHHCADRGIVVISRRSSRHCFLVAAHPEDHACIRDAMNRKECSPSAVLRNLRCAFMRTDLVNERLRGATSFRMKRDDVEWQPCADSDRAAPGWSSSGSASPTVACRRRRVPSSARREHLACTPPAAAATVARQLRTVVVGTTLREQMEQLDPSGRTMKRLDVIRSDLTCGRPCSHTVQLHGVDYSASDIPMEGQSGRNVWRLLHRRTAEGHELVGIADYHGPSRNGRTLRWWEP